MLAQLANVNALKKDDLLDALFANANGRLHWLTDQIRPREAMQELQFKEHNRHAKPAPRTKTLGLRISESDYAALERRAWQSGKTVADWARNVLLQGAQPNDQARMLTHIFTELVAVQSLMMKVLDPLLCGEKLSHDRVTAIFREVQTMKSARAQEVLMKRAQQREE